MPADVTAVLNEIDEILAKFDECFSKYQKRHNNYLPEVHDSPTYFSPPIVEGNELVTVMREGVYRLRPNPKYAERQLDAKTHLAETAQKLAGVLKALREDYAKERLQTFQELIHAEMFSDFLEMAEYLLSEGYRDPAAVIAGSVLEQHLRQLCGKQSPPIPITSTDASGKTTPRKLDTLNADLAKAGAYSKGDQKQITAWANTRNDAAHGDYSKYTAAIVDLMTKGIRDFMNRVPA